MTVAGRSRTETGWAVNLRPPGSPRRTVRLRTAGRLTVGTEVGDGPYRYLLTRRWSREPLMAFVMLNPSSADAERDDPTIRRCAGFARREGWGGIVVANLYALRSPRPAGLLAHPDPEGPWNPCLWSTGLGPDRVGMVVAAWGAYSHPRLPPSHALIEHARAGWYCLGTTSNGSPRHPLYTRRESRLVPWTPTGCPADAGPGGEAGGRSVPRAVKS